MRVAVTSTGSDLNSQLDQRFGRCDTFILFDTDTKRWKAIPNRANEATGGAGIVSAELLVENRVEAVITGHVGPNATRSLKAAEISMYCTSSGTVSEVLKALEAGELKPAADATVSSHHGMHGGASDR